MVSHHQATFGSHSRCGSGDIMFYVAEEDSRCSHSNLPFLLFSQEYGLKAHGISYLYLRSWLHALKPTNGKKIKITIASPSKNTVQENKDKEVMAIAKIFALHKNAIRWIHQGKSIICSIWSLLWLDWVWNSNALHFMSLSQYRCLRRKSLENSQ